MPLAEWLLPSIISVPSSVSLSTPVKRVTPLGPYSSCSMESERVRLMPVVSATSLPMARSSSMMSTEPAANTRLAFRVAPVPTSSVVTVSSLSYSLVELLAAAPSLKALNVVSSPSWRRERLYLSPTHS